MKHKISESQVVADCCALLQINQIAHWRNGVLHGKFKAFGEKSGKERTIKTGVKGMADYSFILPDGSGRTVYLEIKRPGGKLSQDQKDFEAQCIKTNVPYIVVFNWMDLAEILEAYGCLKVRM